MLSAKAATAFLDQLQEEITPYCELEMNEMKKFKRNYLLSRNCNPSQLDDRLYFWDTAFYARSMKETQAQFVRHSYPNTSPSMKLSGVCSERSKHSSDWFLKRSKKKGDKR